MDDEYKAKYVKQKIKYMKLKERYFRQFGGDGMVTIRLMEFNIENGGDLVDINKVVEAIMAVKPDIVAIEEACGNMERLAEMAGYPFYNARAQLMSRFPIIDPSVADGVYMFVEVVPGRIVAVSNVHLPSDPYGPDALHRGATFEKVSRLENNLRVAALERQLEILPELVKKGVPVYLTGDFNVPSHMDCTKKVNKCFMWPISLKLERLGFRDSYREIYNDPKVNPGFTWWAKRPRVRGWNPSPKDIHDRIDFIYSAGSSKTLDSIIVGEVDVKDTSVNVMPWPSDHRAIMSTFSVLPAKMPTFIAINRRLIELGDEIQIRYNVTDDDDIKKVQVRTTDDRIIYDTDVTMTSGIMNIKMDKSIGDFDAVLVGMSGDVMHKVGFTVKPKDGEVLLSTKEKYKQGEPVVANWKYGPGNRFDWVAIRNLKHSSDKWKFKGATTNTKINGSTSFTKDNVSKWPLKPGKYEMVYMIDDCHDVAARTTFEVLKN
jgi:hypothetical protein